VCLLCLPAAGLAAALPARVQQGQLIAASTEPGSAVRIGEREARVDADGRYVFGIERDAPASVTVTIRHRNGKTEQHSLQVVQREYKIERVDGLPPHTVTPDPDLARRIAEEQARVPRRGSATMTAPIISAASAVRPKAASAASTAASASTTACRRRRTTDSTSPCPRARRSRLPPAASSASPRRT